MAFPTKTCAVRAEKFELKADKPGFATAAQSAAPPNHLSLQRRASWTPMSASL
jgi:hypothetical protein